MIPELLVTEFAKIVFGAAIETGVGKATESMIRKARDTIMPKLSRYPDADRAIAAAQQGSQPDLAKVTQYLQAAMKQDPAFAQEVERLAGHVVNVSSIADQRTLNQKSDRSHKTFQNKSKNVGQVGDQDISGNNIKHLGNNFY
ncbi:hypothetical protein MC7420_7850 [Coleofasciculus chthonoplastes PCC 7420]|uniref:Uncharacterized protein n=1 Tax=Coleofasciculus chthonoplastes PCC 7420 TaxID=118168 RepID=B4VIM7_9CYAN|nr:hypothetical protein [Coleofasciculus chthonoplastes]EDX78112.1 hypothetical protein MC7420_7850 [Coleofasciculus chthonoplastes PCC 7420]